MPIVFVHAGYSPYLEFTLRQARQADPDADIILLGDASNDRFPFVRHVDTTAGPYREAGRVLAQTYCHRSTNRRAFELVCFQRWFTLQTFLATEEHPDAIVLDSDVMLYATEAALRRTWLDGADVGLCIPEEQADYRWIASPHVSFWTRAALDAFCAFTLDGFQTGTATWAQFEAKWQHHLEQGLFGGVVDMTALYLFAQTVPPDRLVNFVTVRGGATCDLNVNDAENLTLGEYAMAGPVKALRRTPEGVTGQNRRTHDAVRFHAVHFQGKAKALAPSYYRGPSFPGQTRLRLGLTGHYTARRAASAVLQPARLALARLGLRSAPRS